MSGGGGFSNTVRDAVQTNDSAPQYGGGYRPYGGYGGGWGGGYGSGFPGFIRRSVESQRPPPAPYNPITPPMVPPPGNEGTPARPSGTDPQFFQPIYQPQYQNYSMGNPYAVSMYGQGFGGYPMMGYGGYGGYGGYPMFAEGGIASLVKE